MSGDIRPIVSATQQLAKYSFLLLCCCRLRNHHGLKAIHLRTGDEGVTRIWDWRYLGCHLREEAALQMFYSLKLPVVSPTGSVTYLLAFSAIC